MNSLLYVCIMSITHISKGVASASVVHIHWKIIRCACLFYIQMCKPILWSFNCLLKPLSISLFINCLSKQLKLLGTIYLGNWPEELKEAVPDIKKVQSLQSSIQANTPRESREPVVYKVSIDTCVYLNHIVYCVYLNHTFL